MMNKKQFIIESSLHSSWQQIRKALSLARMPSPAWDGGSVLYIAYFKKHITQE